MHQRKIPFIKAGHRTVLFDPEKVRAALEQLEVKAVDPAIERTGRMSQRPSIG
jgi:hypothetical protein